MKIDMSLTCSWIAFRFSNQPVVGRGETGSQIAGLFAKALSHLVDEAYPGNYADRPAVSAASTHTIASSLKGDAPAELHEVRLAFFGNEALQKTLKTFLPKGLSEHVGEKTSFGDYRRQWANDSDLRGFVERIVDLAAAWDRKQMQRRQAAEAARRQPAQMMGAK